MSGIKVRNGLGWTVGLAEIGFPANFAGQNFSLWPVAPQLPHGRDLGLFILNRVAHLKHVKKECSVMENIFLKFVNTVLVLPLNIEVPLLPSSNPIISRSPLILQLFCSIFVGFVRF